MSYSKDFRQTALSIREKQGLSLLETAELLGIGVASLFRWTKKPEANKTRNKPARATSLKFCQTMGILNDNRGMKS